MKLKYHVVEYISYVGERGYPGLGTDSNTMERIHFLSKKKAKRFIKRFIESDPDYVKQWIAYITLHTVTERIKMVKFPSEWEKTAISKKGNDDVYKEEPILQNKVVLNAEGESEMDVFHRAKFTPSPSL